MTKKTGLFDSEFTALINQKEVVQRKTIQSIAMNGFSF